MGSSSKDSTVRYAEYWENLHYEIMDNHGADQSNLSLIAGFNAALDQSPYGDAATFAVDDSFFSSGYSISSFPALWDMFGKFMAGLDVHTLWEQTFTGINSSAAITDTISSEAAYLDDDIETNVLPRFEAGMRNINAVQSSAFAVGRSLIEDSRIKAINKFSAQLRLRALDLSVDAWKSHLDWNKTVMAVYSQMFKLYYSVQLDVDDHQLMVQTKDVLWNLNLFEYVRGMMGMVSGSAPTQPHNEPSQLSKSISGTVGGAVTGYEATGSYYGAIVGGVVGLATSFIN
jgi:hypothetical protein